MLPAFPTDSANWGIITIICMFLQNISSIELLLPLTIEKEMNNDELKPLKATKQQHSDSFIGIRGFTHHFSKP